MKVLFPFGVMCFLLHAATASPLAPADEAKTFQISDKNLVVELIASEPQIVAPVAMAWDASMRLYVVEMTDYPEGSGGGRIKLLQDRDASGRYRRQTIFADALPFPNGVMPWRDGVLVTAAPDIWFLRDTNGDGVADERRKILTGFTEGNQQLRVNGLYWGIDNWIYGANGRSDGEIKWTDGTPAGSIRRRDFRFRPDTREFEAIAGNSQFGTAHDDWGNRFPVFNNMPIRQVVLEDKYAARVPQLTLPDPVPSIASDNRLYPITESNFYIPQTAGYSTSACGPLINRGYGMGAEYYAEHFSCEPVQNLITRRHLSGAGPQFVAERVLSERTREFFASTDPWFHPVFLANGPDGAIYVVDFYRKVVEHPHWVAPELRPKIEWKEGESHGRIWRIRAGNAKTQFPKPLERATVPSLATELGNKDGWVRDTARRILFERADTKATGTVWTPHPRSVAMVEFQAALDGKLDDLDRIARESTTNAWLRVAIAVGAASDPWSTLNKLLSNPDTNLELLHDLAVLCGGTDLARIERALNAAHNSGRVVLLAGFFEKSRAVPASFRGLVTEAETGLGNLNSPVLARKYAARLLGYERGHEQALLDALLSDQPPAVQIAAVTSLINTAPMSFVPAIFDQWPRLSRAVRQHILSTGARDPKFSEAIIAQLEGQRLSAIEVDLSTRQLLRQQTNPELKARVEKLFANPDAANREKVVREYHDALQLKADKVHGQAIYSQICATCHMFNGAGAKIGPDLSGVGSHVSETLLTDILDPNRQVLPDFVSYTCTTAQGDVFGGIIASESAANITLRRPNEADITIARNEIKELRAEGKSLMPEGLEQALSKQDVADLLAFLQNPSAP